MLGDVLRYALPAFAALLFLGVGGAASPLPALHVAVLVASSHTTAASPAFATCPRFTLPDGDVCVHLPAHGAEQSAPDPLAEATGHHDKQGRWQAYDDIPRRPDRPADYDAYRYPVPPGLPGGHSVVSGYDLDRPDLEQRRGRTLRAVGHGGVDLPQTKGTPVHFVPLEHQQGDADVLFVGPLFGTTVITRHAVREGGHVREYVLIYGHLDSVPPEITAGKVVKEGDVVGFVGDTGSPELVHLHLEARRVRDGVDVVAKAKQGGALVLADEVSIVCDPRNVLPLK
jgi:murein DD-endopeptidase MepM/ murein hydrolase activator NlpD